MELDSTVCKPTDETPHLSEESFRGYFEMGLVGIVVTSPEKGLFHFNDKLCEILGYTREELVQKNWAELTHPEDLPPDAAQFARVLAGEIDGYEVEKRFIRKDGSTVHVHMSGKCLRENSSRSLTLVAMVQDISVRKLAEAALRQSEERFYLAVRGSSDGIWDWDIRLNHAYYAPRIRELLGYQPSEFPDALETFDSHLHPEDRERNWAAVNAHLERRVPYDTEYRLRTKAGDYRWFRARGQAVWDAAGKAMRMAGSITDIHSHKTAEAELRRTQALALAAQEEFTHRLISAQEKERRRLADELHDSLGQNLSLIKNHAHLALEQTGLPPDAETRVRAINQAVTEAIAELRNLTWNLRPVQIERFGLTDALASLAEQVAQSARISFELRFENVDDLFPGEEATILYRIMQEALNNLIKHSQATSAVVVLERDLCCVRIQVEDNGRGFDATANSSRRDARSGIGLTSINERVRMLGGTLDIQSAPGRGTRITIELPVPETSGISPAPLGTGGESAPDEGFLTDLERESECFSTWQI